jgi:CheY-like chemotaxis protein
MSKILLVEKTEIVIDLLQKKLEKEGYEVLVARDRDEGMNKIREKWPDLVIVDVDIPRMEGLEIMEEISKDPELKAIPVIVIADSDQSLELRKAKALGARDWLIKTEFEPPELLKKIQRQIGR